MKAPTNYKLFSLIREAAPPRHFDSGSLSPIHVLNVVKRIFPSFSTLLCHARVSLFKSSYTNTHALRFVLEKNWEAMPITHANILRAGETAEGVSSRGKLRLKFATLPSQLDYLAHFSDSLYERGRHGQPRGY